MNLGTVGLSEAEWSLPLCVWSGEIAFWPGEVEFTEFKVSGVEELDGNGVFSKARLWPFPIVGLLDR